MKDSKNLVIGLLCAVVCVMAVAYAAFSTNLEINATTNINSNWNVAITSVSCTTSAVAGGQSGQTAALDGDIAGTSAKFKMGLVQPGDSATCTVTVTNSGNINAKLNKITVTESGDAPITFTVVPTSAELSGRATLASGGNTETITVTGVYNTSVTTQPAVLSKTVGIALTYDQV